MQRVNMKVLIQTPTLVISIIVNCFLIASGHVLMHTCSHALLIRSSQFRLINVYVWAHISSTFNHKLMVLQLDAILTKMYESSDELDKAGGWAHNCAAPKSLIINA